MSDPIPQASNALLSLLRRGARIVLRNGYYIEGDANDKLMHIGFVRTRSNGQVDSIGIGAALPTTMSNLQKHLAAMRRMAVMEIKRRE